MDTALTGSTISVEKVILFLAVSRLAIKIILLRLIWREFLLMVQRIDYFKHFFGAIGIIPCLLFSRQSFHRLPAL